MMRGEIKKMVLDQLRNNGPMTVKALSDEISVEKWLVEGAVRSLHLSGHIEMASRDRRNCCLWQIR